MLETGLQNEANLRNERRVLSTVVLCLILYMAMQAFSMLRLTGVPGIPQFLLLGYRTLDLVMVATFFLYIGGRVKLRVEDLILLIFITYPFLIGISRGNLGLTFFNDTAIFFGFLVKILVLRTLMIRISNLVSLEAFFEKSGLRIIGFSLIFAVAILFMAILLLRSGTAFYYQAPAEITFAVALVLGQGKLLLYFVFLVLALLAGKRMTMIGVMVMGLLAIASYPPARRVTLWLAPLALIMFPAFFFLSDYLSGSNFAFLNKISLTIETLRRALTESSNLSELFLFIDPGRYIEYVSLQPHLTGASLWFGNGFGFRYELDNAFLDEFGFINTGDVSNAHFTPLAIVAKFGLAGLLLWIVFLIRITTYPFDRNSYLQYAARLAFYSVIIQSLFAFGFFINIFTPIYIAIATIRQKVIHDKTTNSQHFNRR